MRVGHCLLLSCALWLLAEQLTEAHEVQLRTEEEDFEAEDCFEFQSWMEKWKKNRLALKEHTEYLFAEFDKLSEAKYYRSRAQNLAVGVGLVPATMNVFAGRFQATFVSLWIGLCSTCAADFVMKSYFECNVLDLIPKVRWMAEEDMRLQKTMLDQLCDEPPFVGLDKTAEILTAGIEQIRPPSWLDQFIDADKPSSEELREGREWLLSVISQLEKKLDYPIDPPKTVSLSAEQVAAMRWRNQGEPY